MYRCEWGASAPRKTDVHVTEVVFVDSAHDTAALASLTSFVQDLIRTLADMYERHSDGELRQLLSI
jgi:hypothetical protein